MKYLASLKSWKTTASSVVAVVFGFIAYKPQYFPAVLVDFAGYLAAIGVLAMGHFAKDADVHSTAAEVKQATKEEATSVK